MNRETTSLFIFGRKGGGGDDGGSAEGSEEDPNFEIDIDAVMASLESAYSLPDADKTKVSEEAVDSARVGLEASFKMDSAAADGRGRFSGDDQTDIGSAGNSSGNNEINDNEGEGLRDSLEKSMNLPEQEGVGSTDENIKARLEKSMDRPAQEDSRALLEKSMSLQSYDAAASPAQSREKVAGDNDDDNEEEVYPSSIVEPLGDDANGLHNLLARLINSAAARESDGETCFRIDIFTPPTTSNLGLSHIQNSPPQRNKLYDEGLTFKLLDMTSMQCSSDGVTRCVVINSSESDVDGVKFETSREYEREGKNGVIWEESSVREGDVVIVNGPATLSDTLGMMALKGLQSKINFKLVIVNGEKGATQCVESEARELFYLEPFALRSSSGDELKFLVSKMGPREDYVLYYQEEGKYVKVSILQNTWRDSCGRGSWDMQKVFQVVKEYLVRTGRK